MARKVRLPIVEKGSQDTTLLFLRGWEGEWSLLKGTFVGDLFTEIDQETENHAYRRWTRPLAQALGPSPHGCLLKIPRQHRGCYHYRTCPLHDRKQCHVLGAKMPWCFEPAGVEDEAVRKEMSVAISEWRDDVNIVVVL